MPGVESGTYISDLNVANPASADGIGQGDDHLRWLKSAIKNTFTAITGAVTATHTDLNNISGISTPSTGVLQTGSAAQAGTLRAIGSGTNPSVDIVNNGTGATLKVGTTTVATVDASGNWTFTGNVNAISGTLQQAGNSLLPTGTVIMWAGSATAIPSGWQLCDGSAGAPDLRGQFIIGAGNTGAGASYGPAATGGAASVTPSTASAGAHTHGGQTGAGGFWAPVANMDTQGSHSHGGADGLYTLQDADIPFHSHGFQTTSNGGGPATGVPVSIAGGGSPDGVTYGTGGGGAHQHAISADGGHAHNVAVSTAPNHQHSISSDGAHTHAVTVAVLPPFYALCFIMKS